VFFPTWDTSSGAPTALLRRATLVLHENCIFARTSGGDLLIVWPDGYTFDATHGGSIVGDGHGVMIGDAIRLGGGAFTEQLGRGHLRRRCTGGLSSPRRKRVVNGGRRIVAGKTALRVFGWELVTHSPACGGTARGGAYRGRRCTPTEG
jgi:hypothetical protein